MSQRLNLDYKLVGIVYLLIGFGVLMVYSASHLLAYRDYDDALYYMQRQIVWVGIGTLAMFGMSQIPYTLLRRFSVPFMGITLAILFGVFAFGEATNGARRWLMDGSLQPSELAKLATIIYVGHWLASRNDKLRNVSYGLVAFDLIVGLIAGLVVVQPDLSTGVVLVLMALAMFYAAGAPKWHLAVTLLGVISAAAVLMWITPWRFVRYLIFINPLKDKTGEGFQIFQMLLAMAGGGLTGQGFATLNGTIGYLPAAHTDAIFAVIGNDFGFLGCTAVVLVFIALTLRGLQIAQHAPDTFGYLLATGITAWLACQALLNIASTTATIPFTGIPLPFISLGGSALVAAMAGIGILLNIASSGQRVRAVSNRMASAAPVRAARRQPAARQP